MIHAEQVDMTDAMRPTRQAVDHFHEARLRSGVQVFSVPTKGVPDRLHARWSKGAKGSVKIYAEVSKDLPEDVQQALRAHCANATSDDDAKTAILAQLGEQ